MVDGKSSQSIGKIGEEIALNFLRKKGYKIIKTNFYTHWGEIDIIARKKEFLVFVEVKTRVGVEFGYPYESITPYKIRSLMRAINFYLLKEKKENSLCRLDVVSVVLDENEQSVEVKLFENVNESLLCR